MIRTAVLLAAGRGTRLGSLTTDLPKAMLSIGPIPVIDRAVAGLRAAGIERVVVVTGHLAEHLEAHLADSPGVEFVRQIEPLGTGHALLACKGAFDPSEPFFVAWADIVMSPDGYATVVEAWRPGLDGVIGVNRMSDPSAGAAVVFDETHTVSSIVEKPHAADPPSRWNNSGLMVLGPAIWPHVEALRPSVRGELELPDAIAGLLGDGGRVVAVELQGSWFDVGSLTGLEAARALFG